MEFVWVVKRDDLFRSRYPHGFEVLEDDALGEIVLRIVTLGFFVERRHAERDWSMKQIIPYCVVVSGGRVLRTRRLSKGGEARLHGKRSIGIGGHVNPEDGRDVLGSGLRRELEEELEFGAPWTARAVGLLNDDATEVGAVHTGLVYVVETAVPPRIRETDMLEGEWVTIEELARSVREERGTYETWSAFVIERMAGGEGGVPHFVPPGGIAAAMPAGGAPMSAVAAAAGAAVASGAAGAAQVLPPAPTRGVGIPAANG